MLDDFFSDARFQIPDGVILRDVVDKLRDISFIELDADVKGDLYEYLLNQLATSGKAGQFRTPRHIIRTIVQLVNPQIGETILDPACGTGGFLLGAYEWIKTCNSDPNNIIESKNGNGQIIKKGPGDKLSPTQWQFLQTDALTGFDVDASMVKIATMNLILHGLEKSRIIRRDSIAGSPDDWDEQEYDVILTNPPFAGTINKERVKKSLPVQATDTTILFLGLIIEGLRQGGRAGVIVNEGVLFNRNRAAKELRRYLMDRRNLIAVVSLPGGVFQPYSGVKTSVLFFNNDGKKTEKVWFYDVRYDGFELATQRRPTPDKNDLPDLIEKWKDKPNSERSWTATHEQIEENDYILSASAYRPITEEKTHYREPKEIFKEIKELNEQLQEQLKKVEEFLNL
jgi:type I restriction enzyme M protein